MDMSAYLLRGIEKTGSRAALADALGLRPNQITDAKRKGLPVAACFQLAEITGDHPAHIIAASALVTETRPDRRAVLNRALCIMSTTKSE